MSTLYETLIFVHVVAAAIIVGSGVLLFAMQLRTLSTGDAALAEERARNMAATSKWAGPMLILPAAVVLIVVGVWAVENADLDFSQAWLSIGATVWVIAAVVIGPLHAINGKKLAAGLSAGWQTGRRVLVRETVLTGVETALLLFAVWAMVAKPG
ncbi:MAG: DUF2269 family protein [Miltoncostaeaceae bacterium]